MKKGCETCRHYPCMAYDNCKAPDFISYQSKPASPIGETVRTNAPTNEEVGGSNYPEKSPIGETVLTDEKIEKLFIEFTESGWINSIVIRLICKAQDAHTRKEVAKEITAILQNPEYEDYDKFRAIEHLIEKLEG
jgi:hypothetical protein